MSSGYGLAGGPSRCYPFWQELLACYVVNTSAESDEGKKKCVPALEDYYECLHHRKEAQRVQTLQAAYRKHAATQAGQADRDAGPRAGEIRSLGLLQASDEEKMIRKPGLIPTMSSNK